MLRRSMLEVFSWIATAYYEHFSGKKQHVAGIIEEEFHVVKRFTDKKQHLRAAFCKEERGELRRFSRKIRYVETPYWAEVAY